MLAVGAGAPAALAHPAREERPGAPQLDREVLVPPPLDDQLTPGATDADVSVDGFGNRFTVALEELPASPDTRAPRPARTAAWRWVSIDRGDSWDNVDVLPARADLLLPPATSVAAASDGPRTALAEDLGGVVRVQPVMATGLGRFTAGTPAAVASGISRRVDVTMRGTTVLLLAGHPSGAYAVYRSTDGGSSFSLGTVLPEVSGCSLAVDPRRASTVVVASCTRGDQVVVDVSTTTGPPSRDVRWVVPAAAPRTRVRRSTSRPTDGCSCSPGCGCSCPATAGGAGGSRTCRWSPATTAARPLR